MKRFRKLATGYLACGAIAIVTLGSVTVSPFQLEAWAHHGGLESSSEHKDNKNRSRLGSYHYHGEKHPAHLHERGICPYSSSSQQTQSTDDKYECDLKHIAEQEPIANSILDLEQKPILTSILDLEQESITSSIFDPGPEQDYTLNSIEPVFIVRPVIDLKLGKVIYTKSILELGEEQECEINSTLDLEWEQEIEEDYVVDPTNGTLDWNSNTFGSWYQISDSEYIVDGFFKIYDHTYYFDFNGYMMTGWLRQDNLWYYFDKNGRMATGYIYIDGKLHKFRPDGSFTCWVGSK